jgi:mRNA-degrading endonuclease RelE of RelBE toxin-antitoxin system
LPYSIEYSADAQDQMRLLTKRQQQTVLDTVDCRLLNQPAPGTGHEAMKKVEFENASRRFRNMPQRQEKPLGSYNKKGRPFAAVIPLRNANEETLALSTSRKFLKIIDRSRVRVKREGAFRRANYARHLGLEK